MKKPPTRKGYSLRRSRTQLGLLHSNGPRSWESRCHPSIQTPDTCADRSRNTNRGQKIRGQVVATEASKDTKTQHKEGHCFTCNKQGHISRQCPDNKGKSKSKQLVKAHATETEDSDNKSLTDVPEEGKMTWDKYVDLGKTLTEDDKITIIRRVAKAQDSEEGDEAGFFLRLATPTASACLLELKSVFTCRYQSMQIPTIIQSSHSKAKRQVLIDSGATDNFITEKLLKRMKIGKL